jgi:hypothetical protein
MTAPKTIRVPSPTVLVWRDWETDSPDPINGIFLIIRKNPPALENENFFPVEAERWKGIPGEPDGVWQIDGDIEIPENDILWWCEMPEVIKPEGFTP